MNISYNGYATDWSSFTLLNWNGLMDLMLILSSIVTRSIISLFVCLGWTAFYLLADLTETVSRTKQNFLLSPNFSMETELKRWRRRYQLTCKFIEHINSCFGFILLLELTKGSLTFITFSFHLVVDLESGHFFQPKYESFDLLFLFTLGWCYILAVITVCSSIRTQVMFL